MSSVSIQNIVKQTSIIQEMITLSKVALASRTDSAFTALSENLRTKVQDSVAAIDKVLFEQKLDPSALAIRSRRAYQWLKYLDQQANSGNHLDALQRINLFLPAVKHLPKYRRYRIEFTFYHTSALFQIQGKSSQILITAQESLIHAPDAILIALLETALGKPPQSSRKQIRDYTFSPSYQTIRESLEYLGIPKGSYSKGSVYDLAESFERVNTAYFNNEIAEPHLTWNNRSTTRKFGHYQWDTDTVMVSRTLDCDRVPEFVVDYVMYHELLHKKLGAHLVNSRRRVHTRSFHEEEARYAELDEAQKFLNKISRKRK